jgi:hypothetical protein
MKLAASCVAAFSILALSCLAQERPAPRRDGNWKVTMETDLPGAPQKPPPITFTQCVTKEDAEDPAKLVPLTGRGETPTGPEKPGLDCKVTDQKLDGATVTWTTRCEGLNPMTGAGEFVYSADRYVGTMKVTISRGDQPVTMTMKYSANRLGDCVK